MKLPLKADFHKSKKKKFKDTIIFVPFFFGKKSQLKKHAELVNELGFDAVTFSLTYSKFFLASKIPFNEYGLGLKHIWTKEISKILDAVEGSKIVFSFSNPTSSALEAIASRKVKDINALICDGGPFHDLWKCNWNFLNYEAPIKLPLPLKFGAGIYTYLLWTRNHEKELSRDLERLPKEFPILSIRGWLDPLVPPSSIEKAFKGHDHLDLEVLNLPEGHHLDGLKNFNTLYSQRVSDFLNQVATRNI